MRALALAVLLCPLTASSARAQAEPELILDFARPRRARPAAPRRQEPPPPPPRSEPRASKDAIEKERPRIAPDRPLKRRLLTVRTKAWFARSSVETRFGVQFPSYLISGPSDNMFYGETDERAADGTMILYSAELAPLRWLSFEAEYGADRAAGTYSEHYWVHAPGMDTLTNLSNGAVFHNPEHEDDRRDDAVHRARREWLAANAYFRVAEGRMVNADEAPFSHSLDAVLGAHRFRQESSYTGMSTVFSGGKFYSTVPLGPISGYDGHYSAQWRAVHVGLREEIRAPYGFAFDALALWAPVAEYRGDGYEYTPGTSLRSGSPNIVDRAHGYGLHFRLGAMWDWSVARLEAGYMRLSFQGYRGSRRYLLSNGGVTEYHLAQTKTVVDGLYAGATLRF